MITFKGFLKEGAEKAPLPKTKEETEKALWEFADFIEGGVANCTIVDTAWGPAVDVIGSVNLCSLSLEYLPFRFNNVKGDFLCSMNKELKSIEGAPKWVKGAFNFEHCWSLKNLDYLALIGFQSESTANFSTCKNLERVAEQGQMLYTGGYIFDNCEKLTSLKGIGTIFGNLNICKTGIRSLHNFHKDVKFCKAELHDGARTGDLIVFNGSFHQIIEDSSLNLMLVQNLKTITYNEKIAPWMKIIEEGIAQKKEVFEVQDELLDAGYEAQAKL